MTSDFIETRVARSKKNVQENFVAVEFVSYKKKVSVSANRDVESGKKPSVDTTGNETVDPKKQQEREMKKARYEVIKFGMSGLNNVEAKKAKIQNLIALGARPTKQRRMNYKRLKEIRREAKETAAKTERASGADNSLSKKKSRKKAGRKDTGVLGIYGKVQKNTARR